MAKITMTEQPEFEVIPADTVIKVKIQECKVEDLDGNFGPWQKINMRFEILEVPLDGYDDLIGRNIWGGVPFKLTDNPDNQLRQWVTAIMGMEPSVGFELDTDDLEGKRCRAIVGNYFKGKDPKQPRHQIASLLPWVTGDTTDSKPNSPGSDPWATPAPSAGDWGAPAPQAAQQPVSAGVNVASAAAAYDEPPF